MKNEYFLMRSYALPVLIAFLYAVLAAILILGISVLDASVFFFQFFILTAVLGTLFHISKKAGLYICKKDVCYKMLRKRSIDVQKIVGIKIIRSYAYLRPIYCPLTDLRRNPLFTVILLCSVQEEMNSFNKSDMEFMQTFHRDVICYAVYDKEAVEYLLHLNPSIEIIM